MTITITTYLQIDGALVPATEFAGRVADDQYIEGAIDLTVGYKPLLSTEQVDLVDQLWAYLVDGVGELAAGRAFSTYYPDMPVQIRMTPRGPRVEFAVEASKINRRLEVPADELRTSLLAAARAFFEGLRAQAPGRADSTERQLKRIAALGG